jgi:adenylylsulfate kinase
VADKNQAFAIWLTGLPASGKSTIARALAGALAARGLDAAVLESDVLRSVFTPHPRYDSEEREIFYRQLAYVGALLAKHGVPVIFDATANRRSYRDEAREQIPGFLEVYVECPLEICLSRDPKDIYRAGREGKATIVPGLQEPYEPPVNPDVVVHGASELPETAAERIISKLIEKRFVARD